MEAYLTMRTAAKYCGYSYEAFRKMIRDYLLPKYGPKRNRFSIHDLDAFMEEPAQFMEQASSRKRGGRSKPITLTP